MSHPQWPESQSWQTPPQDPYASSTGWQAQPPAVYGQQPYSGVPVMPGQPQQPVYGQPYPQPQQYGPPTGWQQQAPPQPQQIVNTVVSQSVKVGRRGPNHALHGMLTLFTCGMWAPVWILVAIFGRR